MTNITIKTREYTPQLYRMGLPYRISGADFGLRAACTSFELSKDHVHGTQSQENHYRLAIQDDPGWLMFILGGYHLDRAKHIAANIMLNYSQRNMQSMWVKTIDDFRMKADIKLYIFDALFDDDNPYRRSLFYEAIQRTDSPTVSVILLGRSDDPITFSKHIGLKPNLIINTK